MYIFFSLSISRFTNHFRPELGEILEKMCFWDNAKRPFFEPVKNGYLQIITFLK